MDFRIVVTHVLWKCNVTFGSLSNIDCKSIWYKAFLCIGEEIIFSIFFHHIISLLALLPHLKIHIGDDMSKHKKSVTSH